MTRAPLIAASLAALVSMPGIADEPLRPRYHFTPPRNFMNDPNGLFLDDSGIYHLYYQCQYPSVTTKSY